MYVAQHHGVMIYGDDGSLIAGPRLIFQVLPSLFGSMGVAGVGLSLAFFALMTIAALTSSISMLEAPVSVIIERTRMQRSRAALVVGTAIMAISELIVSKMNTLFDFIVSLTTKYSQPILGLALCVYAGCVLHRHKVLNELQTVSLALEHSRFWRMWPLYERSLCAALILLTVGQSLRG